MGKRVLRAGLRAGNGLFNSLLTCRWVGAFSGLVYVFLLPCGLHLQALFLKGELTAPAVLLHGFVICLGVANFVAQFFL
ncbi:hypothetical protein HAZT_HAZT007948 [Hyalella azteca]|nr:hypothetical protein HAZT_HAZT007948 [Hyalella azteca]